MPIWSDMNGFPESGFPVLADVSDRICLGTLYANPLKPSGYVLDVLGNNRLLGALAISGALSGVSTLAASSTVTLSSATAPLTLSGANAVLAITGINASIGTNLSRVRRGFFKDLEVTNTPTVQGEPVALISDLARVYYRDINLAGTLLSKPASSAPGTDTFRDNLGADTGIETLAFAIGEKVHGCFELQHDYREGTDLVFHVHWQGITAPGGGTDNVQWRLTYTVSRDGSTLSPAVTIDSPDTAITARYSCYRTDFGAITGTNFKIGDQFLFTLERVAADSDDYAGDCLIETAGIHYQVDRLGSRQIGTK